MSELFDERFAAQELGEEEELEFDGDIPIPPHMVSQIQELLQLGELHDEFDYLGHSFHIRTMRIGEELAALAQTKAFTDVPLAQGRAYATAMVAGALVSVDGQPVVSNLGPNERANAALKFNKVSKWYFYVIDYIYKKYTDLEKKQADTLSELQARLDPNTDEHDPTEDLSESPV